MYDEVLKLREDTARYAGWMAVVSNYQKLDQTWVRRSPMNVLWMPYRQSQIVASPFQH